MKSFRGLVDVAIKGFLQQIQIGRHKSGPFQRLAPNLSAKRGVFMFYFWNKTSEHFMNNFWENNFAPENLVAR